MFKIYTSVFIVAIMLLTALPVAAQGDETCEGVIETALTSTAEHCTVFDNEFICLGFETVEATPVADAEVAFTNPGDLAPLEDIAMLTLAPLDVDTGTWGIAIIHSEAYNMALFGGVTFDLENGTLITTDESTCEAAFAGVVVHAEAETTLTLNGTDITFAATIIVLPQPDAELIIIAYAEDALVETETGEVELGEGTSTEVAEGEAPTEPAETDITVYDDLAGAVAPNGGPVDIPYPETTGVTPLSGNWEMTHTSAYQYTVCYGVFGNDGRQIDVVPDSPVFDDFDFSGGVSVPIFVEQRTGNPLPETVIYDEPAAGVYHAVDTRRTPPIEFTLYIISEREMAAATLYYVPEEDGNQCGVMSFDFWEYRGEAAE